MIPVRSILATRSENSRDSTRRNLNSNGGGIHFDIP
uniref:Uncharacterized protein n=1 Tax=Arundo donax TaxID=35708 RepID=A0A0A8Y165_ARUDO